MRSYTGKKVLIVGLARSGVAAAALLAQRGALVTANDSKSADELGEALSPLKGLPVTLRLGCAAMDCLDGQEALVLSPGIPDTAPFVRAARERGIYVLGEIELASQLCEGELVAVTGTNGKTTTTTLTHEIFKAAGRVSHAVGNIGDPFSAAVREGGRGEVFVCECSSFQMETVDTFHPRAAAFLNLTEDHLNRHGTMAEYARLKMRVFENQTAGDFAVFNADDPALSAFPEQVNSHVLLFSRRREVSEGAFVRSGRVVFRLDGQEKDICGTEEIYIPGPHNLENALAAVCLTAPLGVAPEVIADTLRTFRGVEHRIEFVRDVRGVRYINDSKGTNVDSTIRAVQTMNRPTVIILGGSDKHCDFTPLAEEMLRSPFLREAVLIGVTADQIERTLLACGWPKEKIHREKDFPSAVARCQALAQEGWNALLSPACASFDMFHDYEERGRIFKQLVHELK